MVHRGALKVVVHHNPHFKFIHPSFLRTEVGTMEVDAAIQIEEEVVVVEEEEQEEGVTGEAGEKEGEGEGMAVVATVADSIEEGITIT